ncbi:hypothetical protein GW17_00033977 [Ensete ventricosum]|nr:hypothetical protein GW17_00033977 [Ensete ventricosum]
MGCHLTAKKRWENSCVCSASMAGGEVQRMGADEGVDCGRLVEVRMERRAQAAFWPWWCLSRGSAKGREVRTRWPTAEGGCRLTAEVAAATVARNRT